MTFSRNRFCAADVKYGPGPERTLWPGQTKKPKSGSFRRRDDMAGCLSSNIPFIIVSVADSRPAAAVCGKYGAKMARSKRGPSSQVSQKGVRPFCLRGKTITRRQREAPAWQIGSR